MKRFLITNPRFTGQVEVVYNEHQVLCKIDCTETNMDAKTVDQFKRTISPVQSGIAAGFSPNTSIVEAEYEVSFEMFWKKYDKKINKARCMPLWEKMEKSMKVAAFFGITEYSKFLKKETWRSKADPETYLRNRYWENEYK